MGYGVKYKILYNLVYRSTAEYYTGICDSVFYYVMILHINGTVVIVCIIATGSAKFDVEAKPLSI